MNAAFTLVFLFVFSSMIIRISATILRHTGLPDNVARFQSISALTGTGFTTAESELIVNFPLRRKVLVTVMILGSLGMASVATTFTVALIRTSGEPGAVIGQVIGFAAAIGLTIFIMSNKTLDKKLCNLISRYLEKSKVLERLGFNRLYQISTHYSLSEHYVRADLEGTKQSVRANLEDYDLILLGAYVGEDQDYVSCSAVKELNVGDKVVCYGAEVDHKSFSQRPLEEAA